MAKGYGKMSSGGGGGRGMNNPSGMKQQIMDLQRQMEEQQAKLADAITESSVGGGAIKILMSGDQTCKNVTIDPEFLKDIDIEMLQDMLTSAFNLALEKSKKMQEDQMGMLSGGLSGLGLGF